MAAFEGGAGLVKGEVLNPEGGEFGVAVGLEPLANGFAGVGAAPSDRDVGLEDAGIGLDSEGSEGVVDLALKPEEMWVSIAEADPDDVRVFSGWRRKGAATGDRKVE